LSEREQLFARETEFFGELVHSDFLLRQNIPLLHVSALLRAQQLSILPQLRLFETACGPQGPQNRQVTVAYRGPKCPRHLGNPQCPFAFRLVTPPDTTTRSSPQIPESIG
jgi:hypothetical protein